jgi:hypothetical protein
MCLRGWLAVTCAACPFDFARAQRAAAGRPSKRRLRRTVHLRRQASASQTGKCAPFSLSTFQVLRAHRGVLPGSFRWSMSTLLQMSSRYQSRSRYQVDAAGGGPTAFAARGGGRPAFMRDSEAILIRPQTAPPGLPHLCLMSTGRRSISLEGRLPAGSCSAPVDARACEKKRGVCERPGLRRHQESVPRHHDPRWLARSAPSPSCRGPVVLDGARGGRRRERAAVRAPGALARDGGVQERAARSTTGLTQVASSKQSLTPTTQDASTLPRPRTQEARTNVGGHQHSQQSHTRVKHTPTSSVPRPTRAPATHGSAESIVLHGRPEDRHCATKTTLPAHNRLQSGGAEFSAVGIVRSAQRRGECARGPAKSILAEQAIHLCQDLARSR